MCCVTIVNYKTYLKAIFSVTYVNAVLLQSSNIKSKPDLVCDQIITFSLVLNANIILCKSDIRLKID